MHTDPAVVVGVDGSAQSASAVDWAAADAARRRRPLRIVHAYLWPVLHAPLGLPMPLGYERLMREMAGDIVREAVTRATRIAPSLDVSIDMPVQQAAAALVEASRHADLVVVGNRGLGGFTGLLLGSVGVALAAHAVSPVVVVRPGRSPDDRRAGRVVVGLDGSPDAGRALQLALEQASVRGSGLTAVRACRRPEDGLDGDALVASIAGRAAKYPDVKINPAVVPGRAAAVLVERSAGAELLVVGSRGRGGFTGLLLGSVSQAAIHHAACPVAVVR
ncbi:universal stress protein [Dactylosporangium sp. NPDC049140]|uniref:universal stress protein n=1 Tax=Dactylosporangium sp. NPDC049140 TaxID=3155647 RepID=UPI0033ECDFD4